MSVVLRNNTRMEWAGWAEAAIVNRPLSNSVCFCPQTLVRVQQEDEGSREISTRALWKVAGRVPSVFSFHKQAILLQPAAAKLRGKNVKKIAYSSLTFSPLSRFTPHRGSPRPSYRPKLRYWRRSRAKQDQHRVLLFFSYPSCIGTLCILSPAIRPLYWFRTLVFCCKGHVFVVQPTAVVVSS